jgi:pimeloyl-ACP methyl ester carboxylesterase
VPEVAGPSLILVHGAGYGHRMWKPVVPLLAATFDVRTPDLPGFGATPGPFSLAAAVEQLAAIAAGCPPPVHVCGLSLGAIVAAEFAAVHPDALDRLVLSGITIAPAVGKPARLRVSRRVPWFAARRLTDTATRAGFDALLDELAAIDVTASLPRVRARTLVVCGRRDRACLADTATAARLIPRATAYLVSHVGHLWPMTAPKVFADVMRGFLTSA